MRHTELLPAPLQGMGTWACMSEPLKARVLGFGAVLAVVGATGLHLLFGSKHTLRSAVPAEFLGGVGRVLRPGAGCLSFLLPPEGMLH